LITILLDNKNGNVWDLSQIAGDVTWKTSRIGRAGSLEFTVVTEGLYQSRAFSINNGDIVQVRYGDKPVFHGYIFTLEGGSGETVKVKAYDQIRYLMASDTFIFKNKRASEIIVEVANKFKLKTGYIETTPYLIPEMVEDGKKLLDICNKALDLTLIHGGKNYVLYDDFGALTLRNIEDMVADNYLGEGSLLTDYSTSLSIDQDTYNRIVLYQDNKKTGNRELYIEQDAETIAKWGMLQLYQSVDEKKNEGQIGELLKMLSTLHNRESKTMKLNALGDLQVRAGSYIYVVIERLGLNQPFLVDECSHKFSGALHTMALDVKVI